MKADTAAEVDALERLSEQTVEEPAKKCMGADRKECPVEAVVHVTWQQCPCGGDVRVEVDYCMPCYDAYETVEFAGRLTKIAGCHGCNSGVALYSLRVRKA